jgi:hypothetical protein
MKLFEFIENYIGHNYLIRLLYKEKGGHRVVLNDWDDVSMEYEILKGKGKFKSFRNYEVLYVTDVLVGGNYSEAINIVIEKKDIKEIRKEKLNELSK